MLAEFSSWWWSLSASLNIPEQRARTLCSAVRACWGQSSLRTRELKRTMWVAVYILAFLLIMFSLEMLDKVLRSKEGKLSTSRTQ